MRKISARIISLLLMLTIVLGFLPAAVQTPVHAATQNQLNIVDRANYLYNSTWVCQKTVAGWRGNYTFTKGQTYRIPYGQPVNSGKYVGFGVSVDDFLAAAANASSIFYTGQSEYAGKTSTYYANDCSAFVSWCWGTGRNTTASIPNISSSKGAANSTNIKNLQLGDALNSTSAGHVVLVTGLTYDSSGNLTQIEITEQTPPQLKRSYYTPSALASKYSASYTIYRYSGTVPEAPSTGYLSECTYYPAHGSVKTTAEAIAKSLPCNSDVDSKSETLGKAYVGAPYTVEGLYKNTKGEWWYAATLRSGKLGYFLASEIEYIEQDLSDITISGSSSPNGHVKGSSFVVRGTVSSKYQKLTSVAVYVHDGCGVSGAALTGASAAVSNNSYTLAGSTIDNATAFGSLGLGVHTYAISADYEDYYIKDGTLKKNTGRKYLVEDYFVTISSSVTQSSCSHTYSNITLEKESCTTQGSAVRACSTCGYVYTETVAASGHNYGAWTTVTEGDCVTDKVEKRVCAACGDTQTQTTAAGGHNYSVTVHPATCKDYERYEYTCGTCGHNYSVFADELMSQWLETKPEGVDESLIESKIQYRYSDYETVQSYETELEGYTQQSKAWEQTGSGTLNYVKSWPAGFDTANSVYTQYNNTKKTDTETATGKTTVNGEKVVGYIYWHWCRGTYADGPINRKTSETKTDEFCAFHAFYSTTNPNGLTADSTNRVTNANSACCKDTHWYYHMPVYQQTYTTYQALFTYERWTDYSAWSDTAVTASDTRKVETRTVYRYVNAELGEHNFENGSCTVCGAACNHIWSSGVCETCGLSCAHAWSNGVCKICTISCSHHWSNGTCSTCGMSCAHDWHNGTCGICGTLCSHHWVNGTCTTCGTICGHNWSNGACGTCGTACSHHWSNGICTTCGLICTHSWVNGTCTTCGTVCDHSGGGTVCGTCGETLLNPTITAKYPTIALEEEVQYNIYYSFSDLGEVALEDMGLITWPVAQEEGTIETADSVIPGAIFDGTYYMVRSEGVPAKNLGDSLYFKIYAKLADGSYVYSKMYRYSATTYIQSNLNKSSSQELKQVCVALLNYGAAAQEYFNYKPYSLMNANLTDEQQAMVSAYSADMVAGIVKADSGKTSLFTYTPAGFTQRYPSVSLEGAFEINYYFKPAYEPEGKMTLYYWDAETYSSVALLTNENALGSKVMTRDESGKYAASYDGIAAKELDETVYVAAVYESNGARYCTGVLAYSVAASGVSQIKNGTDAQKKLAENLLVYGYYAKEYFKNI